MLFDIDKEKLDKDWDEFADLIGSPINDEPEFLSPDFPDIIKMIDEGVEESNKKQKLRMPGFHPSFISGSNCLNAYYYHFLNMSKPNFSTDILRIFDNGHSVHSRMQKYLRNHLHGTWKCKKCETLIGASSAYIDWMAKQKDTTELTDYNAKAIKYSSYDPIPSPEKCPVCGGHLVYHEWRVINAQRKIAGEIDGIVQNSRKDYVGLEFKSVNSRTFKMFQARESDILRKYRKQFAIYLNELGIDYGIFVFENKDTQKIELLPVYLEEEKLLTEPVYELIDLVNDHIENGIPIPKPVASDECIKCQFFRGVCNPGV